MLLAERLTVRAPADVAHRVWHPEGGIVFAIAGAGYLAVASLLIFRFHVVTTQALGLVANAWYVLFSRDPHLAAIGFVSSPLPSLLALLLLPFRGWWPALTQQAFAASIVSALFMAGAVYELYQILRDWGLPRIARLGVTVLFALHPLVVYAAATGMGEAVYLFFLLLASRHLLRWVRDQDTMGEIVAGFALAAAYLARYDAVLAGAAAVILVAVISLRRSRQQRITTAICDMLIVGGPLAATVVLWAGAAWLVTGNPFPQLASTYGYLAQLDALRSHRVALGIASAFTSGRTAMQLLSLEPALPAAALILVFALFRSRTRGWLVAVAILGVLPVVISAASFAGWTFPWLRLLIALVPLVTLVVALGLLSAGDRSGQLRRRAWIGIPAAFLMLAIGLPTTVQAMLSPSTGPEESAVLRPILHLQPVNALPAVDVATNVAGYLDRQHFADGTVLVDSFTGFPVILASNSPHQFLITSDRDFGLALASPRAFGVEYLLVPAPAAMNFLGSVDAVNRAFPRLFNSAAASGGLVREFTGADKRIEWRLYRVSAVEPTAQPAIGS